MKKFIGLFVLVIVLAMCTGCTQPAKTVNVTPEATTVPTVLPMETTLAPTMVPTTEATQVVTAVNTTVITTVVTTVPLTAKPVMTPSTKITTIYIRNNTFVPQELTVLPGTGVIWVNDDATFHAVKTTGGSQGMFNSGDFFKGSQFDYTFGANEGTFTFMDTYSNATGMIIVKKGESLVGNPTVVPTATP